MTSGGAIVNLASTAGLASAVGISAYVASKHAVGGVTKNMTLEGSCSCAMILRLGR